MTSFEFYNLVFENFGIYILLLVLVSFFFLFIGKKYTSSWLDPLRINLLIIVFTAVVPLFLFATGTIKFELTLYFILAQLAFWVGYIIFAKKQITFSKTTLINEEKTAYILYIIFLIVYIILISLTYILLGIPLFMASRLEVYSGSGLGIFARIMPFAQIYCIFYSFYSWKNLKRFSLKKIVVIFSFLIFLTTGILSGSRSSFFIFLFVYWGYCYFFLANASLVNKYYKFLLLGLVFSIFSFVLKSDGYEILTGLTGFGLRAISSGDNYFMALPNDIWKSVDTGPWFNHLFSGLLGPLRIINTSLVPPPVGYQLSWAVNPSLDGLATGPLSSPALLGFLYFRWGGIVFSFIIGLLISITIYKVPTIMPKGLLSSIFCCYMYMQMLTFIQDSSLGMSYLFDTILNFCILIILINIILKLLNRDNVKFNIVPYLK
jgi:oligosaccharide repeat unit polymerase